MIIHYRFIKLYDWNSRQWWRDAIKPKWSNNWYKNVGVLNITQYSNQYEFQRCNAFRDIECDAPWYFVKCKRHIRTDDVLIDDAGAANRSPLRASALYGPALLPARHRFLNRARRCFLAVLYFNEHYYESLNAVCCAALMRHRPRPAPASAAIR